MAAAGHTGQYRGLIKFRKDDEHGSRKNLNR